MPEETRGLGSSVIDPAFAGALDDLMAAASRGHRTESTLFNPADEWLVSRMRLLDGIPADDRRQVLEEAEGIRREAEEANAQGKAAYRAGPEAVGQLDSGGVGFYSQLGVARRPDLTQYLIDGFRRNRDGIAFSEASQALFAQVLPYLTRHLEASFESGEGWCRPTGRSAMCRGGRFTCGS